MRIIINGIRHDVDDEVYRKACIAFDETIGVKHLTSLWKDEDYAEKMGLPKAQDD